MTADRVNLRARVRFADGHLLELNEAVIVESDALRRLSYRYHFQDKKNILVFRYDNAPHFPNLESFPNHKHVPGQVLESDRPLIEAVVTEVKERVAH